MVLKFLALMALTIFASTLQAETLKIEKLSKVKWSKAQSDHFVVITDAKPKEAEIYVRELEHFRHFVAVYLQQPIVEGLTPPTFLLIKNKRLFQKVGLPKMWAGVFVPTLSGPYSIAHSAGFKAGNMKPSFEAHTVRHELVHYLVENSLSKFKPPLWYSEGFAEYLATYSDHEDKISVGSLKFIESRFHSLRKRPHLGYSDIDVESLFKAKKRFESTNKAAIRREAQRFYGRSIATVHYLLSDNALTQQLSIYLKLIDAGASVDEAFAKAFNRSYEQLDTEIIKYLEGKKVYGRAFPKDQIKFPKLDIQSKKLTKEESVLDILDVLSKLKGPVKGQKALYGEIHEILNKEASGNVRAEVLKLEAFNANSLEQKLAAVEGLLKRYPESSDLVRLKGEFKVSLARLKFITGEFDSKLNIQARSSLRQALKQNPMSGRAYLSLAESYLIEPYSNKNFDEAVVGYDSAIFFRNEPRYYLKKAEMLLADGSPDLAYPVLKRFFELTDREWEHEYGAFLLANTELATIKSWSVDKRMSDKIIFKNGAVYSGQLKDDWPHGAGVLKSVTGLSYDGGWKDGRADGLGKLLRVDQEGRFIVVYHGAFVDGNVSGKGKLTIGEPENPLIEYEGQFKNGYENGEGRLVRRGEYTYEGGWFKGRFHGKGRLTSNNGKVLESQWGLDHFRMPLDNGQIFFAQVDMKNGEIKNRGICLSKDNSVRACIQ